MRLSNIKEKRKEAQLEYQQQFNQIIDKKLEEVYPDISSTINIAFQHLKDTQFVINSFHNLSNKTFDNLIEVLALINKLSLNELKEIYNFSKNDIQQLQGLEELVYEGSFKNLKQHMDDIFNKYARSFLEIDTQVNENNRKTALQISIMRHMNIIFHTEALYFNNHKLAISIKGRASFCEIVSGENCTSHQINCDDFHGQIHPLAWLNNHNPPYHPNCHCFPIFYTMNEVKDNTKE